jgi:hypothetical protein
VITGATPATNAMELTWNLPAKPGRCNFVRSLITYTYTNCTTDGLMEKTQNVTGDATTATVGDLQPYWDYTFTVTTFTAAGPGQSESDERLATTLGTGKGFIHCVFIGPCLKVTSKQIQERSTLQTNMLGGRTDSLIV